MNACANRSARLAAIWCLLAALACAPCLAQSGDEGTDADTADTDSAGDSDAATNQAGADAAPGAQSGAESERVDAHLVLAELAMQRTDLPVAAREFTLAAEASSDALLAERATQFTFATGFDGYALRCARRWAELAPDRPVPREVMGRLLLRRHDVDRAAEELTRALGNAQPLRDEVYLALAADLSTEDDARLVTRTLSRLAGRDALSPGIQLALGTAALRSGDNDLALAAAEAATIDDPDWVEPRLLAARALAALGQGDAAVARMDTLVAEQPGPAMELEYVRLLAALDRTDAARERFSLLAKANPASPEVQRAAALLDFAAGNLADAGRGFSLLTEDNATRLEAFYYLGQIAARQDQSEEARRWFGRVSSGPYEVPAELAIAESLYRDDKGDEALAGLELFARDHPGQSYDVLEMEAQILQGMKRPDDALAVYARALLYKPDSVRVLLARGALLDQLGRVDESLADLKRAATIAPVDANALNAYGYTLANHTRRSGEAYELIRRALEMEPDSPAIEDSMGWVLQGQGERELARSYLEEAYARLPDPEVASHLAQVWWALGERDRARDLLKSTVAAHPDSEAAAEAARRLLK